MKMQIRHGDILLTKLNVEERPGRWGRIPEDVENGKRILARGEKTGHAHVVTEEATDLYSAFFGGDQVTVLEVKEETQITHEEHAAVTLEPGFYMMELGRRYDPNVQEAPRVLD
jgi:hypothetical protein